MHKRYGIRVFCLLIVFTGLSLLTSCDEIAGTGSSGTSTTPAGQGPSIVSLTPAITQMLVDMGKRDLIVGVSQHDEMSLSVPPCGTFTDPVIAQIIELDPDLVLTESGAADHRDVPPMLRSLAEQGVFELKVIPHSRSVADVERALTDSEVGLGAAIGDAEAGERARRLMSLRLELVHSAVQGGKAPRVLMLINPMTLGAIGSGVTHDELLRKAGAVNAAAQYNTGYLTLTRSQVQQQARPDVVLIFEPGGQPIANYDPRVRALDGLAVPAVVNQRYAVIRHRKGMLPSTALPEVLVEMAKAIHPDRADAIQKAYEAAERVIEKADEAKRAEQADGGGA